MAYIFVYINWLITTIFDKIALFLFTCAISPRETWQLQCHPYWETRRLLNPDVISDERYSRRGKFGSPEVLRRAQRGYSEQ